MLRSNLHQPCRHVAGRRHARWRACSLSGHSWAVPTLAQTIGLTTPTSAVPKRPSGSHVRLGEAQTAVRSCAPAGVDLRGSEHVLCGVRGGTDGGLHLCALDVAGGAEDPHLVTVPPQHDGLIGLDSTTVLNPAAVISDTTAAAAATTTSAATIELTSALTTREGDVLRPSSSSDASSSSRINSSSSSLHGIAFSAVECLPSQQQHSLRTDGADGHAEILGDPWDRAAGRESSTSSPDVCDHRHHHHHQEGPMDHQLSSAVRNTNRDDAETVRSGTNAFASTSTSDGSRHTNGRRVSRTWRNQGRGGLLKQERGSNGTRRSRAPAAAAAAAGRMDRMPSTGAGGAAPVRGSGRRDRGDGEGATAGASTFRVTDAAGATPGQAAGLDVRRINQAIIDAGAERRHEEILKIAGVYGLQFDHVNAATALHRLGSCGLEPGSAEARRLLADPRFAQLERLAGTHLPSVTGREAANCLWALAKLGYQSGATGSAIGVPLQSSDARRSNDTGPDSISGDGSSSRSGGSTGGSSSTGLLMGLCVRAEATCSGLRSQEVANALWALGNLGHQPGESLLRGLTDRLLVVLPEARPQEVSNSLLGLAKLDWSPGAGALDQVARGSLPKIADFKPQELSSTLWSLARLGHRHDQLQDAIFRQTSKRIHEFKPVELASLVFAAATLGLRASDVDDDGGSSRDGGSSGAGPRQGRIPTSLLRQCCNQAVGSLPRYGSQELSNLLWALAKMGYSHEPLLRATASLTARRIAASMSDPSTESVGAPGNSSGDTDGSGVRGISNGSGDSDGSGNSDGSGVRRISNGSGEPELWTAQSVSSVTWSFASLGWQPGRELLHQVCRHLSCRRRLSEYDLSEIVHTTWSLAVLRYHDPAALAAVEAEVLARLATPATLGTTAIRGLEAEQQTRARPALSPPALSDLLWAFATLEQPAPQLFAALLPLLERHLPEFTTQAISNSVWAAAKLGVYDEGFMDTVAEHIVVHRLQQLRPPELASLAWAYGELGHAHRTLFDGLTSCTVSYVWPRAAESSLSLEVLAAVCGAAGVLGWRYPALLDAAVRWLDTLASEERLYRPKGFSDSCSDSVASLVDEWTVTGEAGVACCSCSSSSHISLCGSDGATTKLTLVSGCTVTSTATAAAAAHAAGAVADAEVAGRPHLHNTGGKPCAVGRAAASPPLYSARDVGNLAHALSLVGGCTPRMWEQLMQLLTRAVEAQGGDSVAVLDEELSQLYQAYLHVRLDYPTATLESGPPPLLQRGAAALRQRGAAGRSTALSPFQKEVSEALGRLGLGHPEPALSDDGLFLINLALEVEAPAGALPPGVPAARLARGLPGKGQQAGPRPATTAGSIVRVAVEVDGPSHFTSNTRQPLATTLYRRRCLEARGWAVVSVPYWRWELAAADLAQRDALLSELMREAGWGAVLQAAAPKRKTTKRKMVMQQEARRKVKTRAARPPREQSGDKGSSER